MTLSDQDAFAIRNQWTGKLADLTPNLESIAIVQEEMDKVEIKDRDYLPDAVGFILYRIEQAKADTEARVTANEALVRLQADRALTSLSELVASIDAAEGGRLFRSLATAIAIREGGDATTQIITGGAAEALSTRLAQLEILRGGLADVREAYTKLGRKGGPDPKDTEFDALVEIANVYRTLTGDWPTIRTGGVGEGVTGHFYDVVSIACGEVGAMTPAGRPLFTEAVYKRVRASIMDRT